MGSLKTKSGVVLYPCHYHYLLIDDIYNSDTSPQVIYLLLRPDPSLTSCPCPHTGCMPLHIVTGTIFYMRRLGKIKAGPGVVLELMIQARPGAVVAMDPSHPNHPPTLRKRGGDKASARSNKGVEVAG